MRRYRRTLQIGLLVVIAAFVVTSVVVFGSGGGPDHPDAVATVNGEVISRERFERRHRALFEAHRQRYGERFSPEVAEVLGLRQQVVNDLVQEALVIQRARAEGLETTDEELNAQVHAIPLFHENGRFSLKRYAEALRERGYTKAGFESEFRRDLTRQKVEGVVKGGVKVSETEIEQAYVLRREQVRIAWALIELAPLVAAATATDDELKKHLDAHAAEFRLPERRRIQYVTLALKEGTPAVSQAEIEKYYAEHAKEFESPRQVKAAHILVKVPEGSGGEAEERARAKVADIIRRAKAGEDFAKLARQTSEDTANAAKGGDLGYVSRGEMVREFEEALFALKTGDISPQPVRTPFGFHAVRVTDIREEHKKPLTAVASQIRDQLGAEAAERAALAKVEELRVPLQAAKDFMAEAKNRGLTPVETTVARGDRAPGPAGTGSFAEVAFELSIGGVSLPVKTPTGFALVKSIEALPSVVPPLAEVRDKVAAALKRQKAEQHAAERARQLAADAASGDFAAAATKAGATTGETPLFSRSKPAERLPGDVMVKALQTPLNAVGEPVKAQQGFYVVKVLERVSPDMSGLASEREKLSRELLAQKQGQAWEAWISGSRAKAKVEILARFPPQRG
jgi:peptidyl-prolyl cis-trans isomerase D